MPSRRCAQPSSAADASAGRPGVPHPHGRAAACSETIAERGVIAARHSIDGCIAIRRAGDSTSAVFT
ncbi:hypothetical protein WS67_16410 [Burkholderia singularis]|uniref:Uncharacterized protein n=1 Tax=Burkholderia singularis TaxID=1503053 RepID=A0A103E122_9BURK|nr:hypothetical protein WS67_16410 [Burkholderia singularis]